MSDFATSSTGVFAAAEAGRTEAMSFLKTRILAEGVRVDWKQLEAGDAKPALRVRSGSCGGLDMVLPDGTWVNAPVHEMFAKRSRMSLEVDDAGTATLNGTAEGDDRIAVELVPAPAYYGSQTSAGVPMTRVGQLCSDRIGIGLTNICTFWRSKNDRCRFCSIGNNVLTEQGNKDRNDMVETVMAAIEDPVNPARHILLGGGTSNSDDAGIPAIAELAAMLREKTDVSIYVMVTPPRDPGLLRLLSEAGVDELGMNIEVFTEEAAREFIPGKHAAISIDDYWRSLDYAVDLFGPLNTRSITVAGLEETSETVEGVRRLASIGVLPIISPHRPLDGTLLEGEPRRTANELWKLVNEAAEAAAEYDVPLGPTCIACQSNTLTLPGDHRYRLY